MPAAIPALIGVGGAILGGAIAGKGAKSAANTEAAAADRAAQLQNQQYQQTREDQLAQLAQQRADGAQYREAGYGALSQLVAGTAAGGEFNRPWQMSDMQSDPGYQFRVQQGEQSINRAATAAGARYSGATLKALQRFSGDLSSQEAGNSYNRYTSDMSNRFGRLSSLAGTGQTAVSQAGQAGQNAYGNIASAGQANAAGQGAAIQNAGAARASGYVGSANAINGALGQAYNGYQQQQLLSKLGGSPIVQAPVTISPAGQYFDGYAWNSN